MTPRNLNAQLRGMLLSIGAPAEGKQVFPALSDYPQSKSRGGMQQLSTILVDGPRDDCVVLHGPE
jgi:hypothetical protein